MALSSTDFLYDHPLSRKVIGCAMAVHSQLGAGLLESAYEKCLMLELSASNMSYSSQVPLTLTYRNVQVDCIYKLDLLIEDFLVVEIKSVESLTSLYQAQLINYMKLAEAPLGLLINFNVPLLKYGIRKFSLSS